MRNIFLLLFLPSFLMAITKYDIQQDSTLSEKNKVKVMLGPDYEASKIFQLFMGEHWRDLWTTEIELPILDLNSYAGGLTPLKKGGSFQTKSLRFIGEDGKQYKFRSIDKDPTQSLPLHMKQSLIAEVLQDQTSISNPVAAIIVPKLLDAVGVINVHPTMYVSPDDEKLGEFREEFAGLPGTIEENLKSKKGDKGGYKEFSKIITGFDIYEKTRKNNKNKVDEAEFLKARLMDILFGDRDRHGDQWKWAANVKGEIRYWLPIPRDRDFAFCLYDGWFPELASRFEPSSIGYGESFPPMKNQTYIGRHLDRRFLNSLTKEKWDSVATFIKDRLTDDVIREAVKDIPKAMFDKKGEYLYETLLIRRDKLSEVADEYYNLLYETADIYGTDKSEYFEVNRIKDGEVSVNVYELDKEGDMKSSTSVFSRLYNSDITNEIRIYMLNGKNKAIVKGEVDKSILVRIIGGDDKDVMRDSSSVSGYFLDFTPIPDDEEKTEFYDSGKKTKFVEGSGTIVNKNKEKKSSSEIEMYEPNLEDRYSFFFIDPTVGYNTHDGARVGIVPNFTQYGFRADPYLYSLSLSAVYATDLNDFEFNFSGRFNNILSNYTSIIKLRYSQIDIIEFYGFGNQTRFSKSLYKDDYYRIEQKLVSADLSEEYKLNKSSKVEFGVMFEYSEIEKRDSNFLKTHRRFLNETETPYGIGKRSYFGVGFSYNLDTRKNKFLPKNSFYIDFMQNTTQLFLTTITNTECLKEILEDTYQPKALKMLFLQLESERKKTLENIHFTMRHI